MLTDTLIRNAKPQAKPYKLPREAGLFILVNPNGSKWWRFAYRFGGRELLLSLGTYPAVSLSMARQRRDEAHRLIAAGVNPSDQRREAREAAAVAALNTFTATVERWKPPFLASLWHRSFSVHPDTWPGIKRNRLVSLET